MLHVCREPALVILANMVEKGLQVLSDDLVEDGFLGLALAIPVARLEQQRGHSTHRRMPCHPCARRFRLGLLGLDLVYTLVATATWPPATTPRRRSSAVTGEASAWPLPHYELSRLSSVQSL